VSQGRTYKPEFKQMAVEMVLDGDKSVAAVAGELGINEWTLRNWVKKARKDRRRTGATPEEVERDAAMESPDLRRAEQRIRELEMEVAFLKKAAAYFAKEQQ
jgi:transposase